jgi:hypothetical protein
MPRKRPFQVAPLRRHYSADLKQRIIHQAYTLHRRSEDITTDLDMPLRVVQRVKRTWNEIGEVCRDRQHQGRAPLLSVHETQVCWYLFHCAESWFMHWPANPVLVHAGTTGTFSGYLSRRDPRAAAGAAQFHSIPQYHFPNAQEAWNKLKEGNVIFTMVYPFNVIPMASSSFLGLRQSAARKLGTPLHSKLAHTQQNTLLLVTKQLSMY